MAADLEVAFGMSVRIMMRRGMEGEGKKCERVTEVAQSISSGF